MSRGRYQLFLLIYGNPSIQHYITSLPISPYSNMQYINPYLTILYFKGLLFIFDYILLLCTIILSFILFLYCPVRIYCYCCILILLMILLWYIAIQSDYIWSYSTRPKKGVDSVGTILGFFLIYKLLIILQPGR